MGGTKGFGLNQIQEDTGQAGTKQGKQLCHVVSTNIMTVSGLKVQRGSEGNAKDWFSE